MAASEEPPAVSSSSASSVPKPTIAIVSIGEMGLGIAKVLRAHHFPVVTLASGRSAATTSRIESAKITILTSDADLVSQADLILSIVPSRSALPTAKRVAVACTLPAAIAARNARRGTTNAPLRLTYIDLNPISPSTVSSIEEFMCPKPEEEEKKRPAPVRRRTSFLSRMSSSPSQDPPPDPIPITFIDGGVIGPPPSQNTTTKEWKLPSIVTSGPILSAPLAAIPDILNFTHLSAQLGAASTLKACFAALNKGMAALGVMALTTAYLTRTKPASKDESQEQQQQPSAPSSPTSLTSSEPLTLLPSLLSHLTTYSPNTLSLLTSVLPTLPAKSTRWADEMTHTGSTLATAGGFEEAIGVFGALNGAEGAVGGFSDVFALLGKEMDADPKVGGSGARKRGRSLEEVVKGAGRAVKRRRDGGGGDDEGEGEGELKLTWRGSWT